jgi:hypothetical protein
LVISLDSQNQDYLPDLSGPTGNCQKLAAEFRGGAYAGNSRGVRIQNAEASADPSQSCF